MNPRFTNWTFLILLVLSLILVVHLLFRFITPLIMAMVIVSLFNPLYHRLLRRLQGRDYLASGIITVAVLFCVALPCIAFFMLLIHEGLSLFQATEQLTMPSDISSWLTALKRYLESFNQYLELYGMRISSERILKATTSMSQTFGKWAYDAVGFIAANLLSLFLNLVLTIALVFVLLISGKQAKDFIMELIPLPHNEKERIALRFKELASAVFIGNGLISVFEGILGGLSFFAFSMPLPLLFGVLIAATAFLPLIGAAIVILPATIYLFLVGKTWQAIVFLAFNGLQLTLLETLIKPRMIGTKSQMHAVLVFMSVLAGVQIYGAFGLFYGPLMVTVFLTLAEIYKEHYRDDLLKY